MRLETKKDLSLSSNFFDLNEIMTTKFPVSDELKEAVRVLRAGGVILYPTDTVWGIGCDATNHKSVERVFEIKRRPSSKSMIVLLDNMGKIPNYVEEMPDVAWDLVKYATEPLTVIYQKGKNLAPNVVGEDGSVAIRITREEVSRSLCRMLCRPLISTSANMSGQPSAATFGQISEEIKAAVDYIVPLRQNEHNMPPPSRIVKLYNDGVFKVIRGCES